MSTVILGTWRIPVLRNRKFSSISEKIGQTDGRFRVPIGTPFRNKFSEFPKASEIFRNSDRKMQLSVGVLTAPTCKEESGD